MTSENIKTLEFNRYQKSDKTTFVIYADLKCIKENIGRSKKWSGKFINNKSKQIHSIQCLQYLHLET